MCVSILSSKRVAKCLVCPGTVRYSSLVTEAAASRWCWRVSTPDPPDKNARGQRRLCRDAGGDMGGDERAATARCGRQRTHDPHFNLRRLRLSERKGKCTLTRQVERPATMCMQYVHPPQVTATAAGSPRPHPLYPSRYIVIDHDCAQSTPCSTVHCDAAFTCVLALVIVSKPGYIHRVAVAFRTCWGCPPRRIERVMPARRELHPIHRPSVAPRQMLSAKPRGSTRRHVEFTHARSFVLAYRAFLCLSALRCGWLGTLGPSVHSSGCRSPWDVDRTRRP